jgi:hypothetical protein
MPKEQRPKIDENDVEMELRELGHSLARSLRRISKARWDVLGAGL